MVKCVTVRMISVLVVKVVKVLTHHLIFLLNLHPFEPLLTVSSIHIAEHREEALLQEMARNLNSTVV